MSIFSRFFPDKPKPVEVPAASRPVESGVPPPRNAPAGRGIRAELLRLTLRDTLRRHGLPREWVTGEPLAAASSTGQQDVRWRLTVKHWDLRLVVSLPALQQQLLAHLRNVDRTADEWLRGIVWEFALPEGSPTPAMPSARYWAQAQQTASDAARPGPSGNVISGPVHVDGDALARRQQLEQELARRDGEFQHASEVEATRPMSLNSRPGSLG